jgi:hypothetical protein
MKLEMPLYFCIEHPFEVFFAVVDSWVNSINVGNIYWRHVLLSCCVQVLLKPGMDQGKVTVRGESVTESVHNTVSGVAKGTLGSTL